MYEIKILRHLAKNNISFSQATNSYCEKGQYNDISKTEIFLSLLLCLPCIKSRKLFPILWTRAQEHDL